MAQVFIPSLLRRLTGGRDRVQVEGATIRQVIDSLDEQYPGIRERLIAEDCLRSNLVVAVDGEVSTLGLLEPVRSTSEIHFVQKVAGGIANLPI